MRIARVPLQEADLAKDRRCAGLPFGIRRRLAELDKSNKRWRRNITSTLGRIGDLKLGTGDSDGALRAYEEMLANSRQVAEADAEDIAGRRDLALSLENVAKMKRAGGDSKAALAATSRAPA